jgi:hypothetical protein
LKNLRKLFFWPTFEGMKKTLFCALCSCLALAALGQPVLQDDFSDGDLTANPQWLGDVDKFAVTAGELQLLDPAPATNNISSLFVPAPTSMGAATTWEFYVRLDFSPSATNFARVYLSASAPGLAEPQQGYFIRVGGIAGDQDALDFFRQDGTNTTLLFSGQAGAVGGATAVARVRVERSAMGEWSLWADYSGGTDLAFQGSATDDTYPMGAFFGFYCRYTSTRGQHFFFDDVLVAPLFEDTTPPTLLNVEANSAEEVLAFFDEPLDSAAASNPAHYSIDNGIGSPTSALLVESNPNAVRLALPTPLQNTQRYLLTAENIRDLSGNLAPPQSAEFTYLDVQPASLHDVIISEIYADESASQGLPEEEFFELYNRSDKVIQLSSLRYTVSNSTRTLPSYLLLPGAYVTICPEAAQAEYAAFGPAVGLLSFPRLPNSGSTMRLVNAADQLVFTVTYSSAWYRDPGTANGGFSLELIQLDGPYDCPGNWRASRAPNGGTPGQANSRLGESGDDTPPALITAAPESAFEIRLLFDEPLDPTPAGRPENYRLAPAIPIDEAMVEPGRQAVLLLLDGELAAGTAYELIVDQAVTDCMGNPIGENDRVVLGLAEPMAPGDVVVNELLFWPAVGGSPFVELYNRSAKIINLRGADIRNRERTAGNVSARINQDYLLLPGAYAVLARDPEDVLARYFVEEPRALLTLDLPTLDSRSGNLSLIAGGIAIDSFDYNDNLHYPLLDSKRGVSLERISPDAPTQDAGNWHSAASTIGFATPTARNSQFIARPSALSQLIDIPNTTFSPDGDGFEDVLLIHYELDQPGYTLKLHVYDSNGRLVRRLANNETLPLSGTLQWDGTTEELTRARLGIYVLWFELFTPDGVVGREKRACVLAGRLE